MENLENDKIMMIFAGNLEGESREKEVKAKGKYDKFLGAKFRLQMKNLMEELSSSDCHFVRFIIIS